MSRSYVLVLIPDTVPTADIDHYTQDLFLPFMRDYEFPPYDCLCECVDGNAEYCNIANREVGHFHVLWRTYTLLPPAQRPAWHEYISAWVQIASNLQSSPDDAAPGPECDYCAGVGVRSITWYGCNLYDYWIDMAGDVLGPVAQLTEVLEPRHGQPDQVWYQLATPTHAPFSVAHVVTPDGQPYSWNEHHTEETWIATCHDVFDRWRTCRVVRCLVHE